MTRLLALLGVAALAALPSPLARAQSPLQQLQHSQEQYQLRQFQDTLDSIDARQRDEQLLRDERRLRHPRGSYGDDDRD